MYKNILYIEPLFAKKLLVFDMGSRRYSGEISLVDNVFLPDSSHLILKFYGEPLQILLLITTNRSGKRYYCLYYSATEAYELYPLPDYFLRMGYIPDNYTPLGNCEFITGYTTKIFNTELLKFNISNGNIVTVLENIPHTLGGVKEVRDGKLGFVVFVHDHNSFPNFGSKSLTIFCLWKFTK
jgi:hypothetical protein